MSDGFIEVTCKVNKQLKLKIPLCNIDYISKDEFGTYIVPMESSSLKKPLFYIVEDYDKIG